MVSNVFDCDICHHKHRRSEPHVFTDDSVKESRAKAVDEAKPERVAKVETVSRAAAGRSVAATFEMMRVTAGETAPIPEQGGVDSHPVISAKFDRNAYHKEYMREYMRKRRARQKEKRGGV